MAFAQPLLLLLLLAVPYFVYLGRPVGRYGRWRAWAALLLRCLIAVLIVLGLAGTRSVHGGSELAVVFLLDVSDSISDSERERALDFVAQAMATMRPDDRAALVLFGADALVERPMMGGGDLGAVASIPHTHQTDLEAALRLGMALFPAGAARRMVVLSDGSPTTGEAERAVRLARAQSVQVDVVTLSSMLDGLDGIGLGEGEALLSELAVPERVHQGEEFTLSATVNTVSEMAAVLTVLAGDKVVAQHPVRLNPGDNTFAFPLVAEASGFTPFQAYVAPSSDTYPQNNGLSAFSLVEGPPRVLVVSSAPQGEPEGAYLQPALEAAGLEVVVRTPDGLASELAGLAEYAAVVLVDTPAQSLSPRALTALQSYVRNLGGGLVAVGGPHAYGVGGWYNTPLEDTLPVEMTIQDQERFPPMSIVVVIDKSGSMSAQEGAVTKIRLAGEAAARVAELITDLDEITVLAFDDRPADIIGPLPGSQREDVIHQVIRLQAGGGGIYVRESLQEALGYLVNSERAVRHIILLADGSDAEHQQGVQQLVEEEIAGQNISLSTVAIGAGQDLRFLEEIAALGNGRYHFTDQAANLPVIFAEETQLAMRSYLVEEPFFPRRTSMSPILTGIETVPQLAGYVATTPKPAGRVILSTHQDDPLLAAWQYGLGRAVAWTSDATARWAQRWVAWDGFSRFWAQAVRWTIAERTDIPAEVSVTLEGATAQVAVDVLDDEGTFIDGLDARMSIVGPDGNPLSVALAQTAPGHYEGTFPPQLEGAYLMRLAASLPEEGEEVVALTTGWVMGYSPEYAALEADTAYLARLAELGEGRVLENPTEAFAHTQRGTGARRDLWPYLLGLATLLLPVDVAVRRLAVGWADLERARVWVSKRLPRRRIRLAGDRPSLLVRLFDAKSRVEERRPEAGVPPETELPQVEAPTDFPLPSQPAAPPPAPSVDEAETLAERLLHRRRSRRE